MLNRHIEPLSSSLKLNESEIKAINTRSQIRQLKRKQFLLAEGGICKYYNFVLEDFFKIISRSGRNRTQYPICG